MRAILHIGLILAAVTWVGCEPAIDLPKDFIEVESIGNLYDVRAVSAEGVVIGLSHRENPRNGSLEFWSQAISNDLLARGYEAGDEEDVTGAAGAPGKLLAFRTDKSGREFGYRVALFVRDRRITIAEAGGRADALAERADEVRKSLLSAR